MTIRIRAVLQGPVCATRYLIRVRGWLRAEAINLHPGANWQRLDYQSMQAVVSYLQHVAPGLQLGQRRVEGVVPKRERVGARTQAAASHRASAHTTLA